GDLHREFGPPWWEGLPVAGLDAFHDLGVPRMVGLPGAELARRVFQQSSRNTFCRLVELVVTPVVPRPVPAAEQLESPASLGGEQTLIVDDSGAIFVAARADHGIQGVGGRWAPHQAPVVPKEPELPV